ncbi:hypothetical protein [Corynebacterium lubricantis]|uniref:hypothetical protein n=1 Tax=Corynebacterium lubricantis TaxID=541095 RepID=UPI00037F779C|nr:hypothetical protein [Corynebacterium lubricantis]
MNIPIPTDDHNFLRRECPTCEQQFKWHLGPIDEDAATQPTPTTYYCPLCGVPASTDQWWTKEQLEYARDRAMPEILAQLANETGLHVESTTDVPGEMVEVSDMMIVQSPCHAFEPIKVPDRHQGPLHCLVCGSEFIV